MALKADTSCRRGSRGSSVTFVLTHVEGLDRVSPLPFSSSHQRRVIRARRSCTRRCRKWRGSCARMVHGAFPDRPAMWPCPELHRSGVGPACSRRTPRFGQSADAVRRQDLSARRPKRFLPLRAPSTLCPGPRLPSSGAVGFCRPCGSELLLWRSFKDTPARLAAPCSGCGGSALAPDFGAWTVTRRIPWA